MMLPGAGGTALKALSSTLVWIGGTQSPQWRFFVLQSKGRGGVHYRKVVSLMVNFDIITVEADSDFKEQLARHLHPAVRLLIKLNRSTRWVQLNLDTSHMENRCWKFSGILSHTMYLDGTTYYQETEARGRYAFSHKRGTLTIL